MLRCFVVGIASVLLIACSTVQAEITLDFLMDADPAFELKPPVKNFTRDFKGVWTQALERPEIDMQRMAAETIAAAHKHGIPGLSDVIPTLEKVLVADTSHPTARFAAARALLTLESKSSAEKLLKVSQQYGSDLRQIVEPVLADWDYGPAKEIWVARLKTPDTKLRELVLAIRGLGKTRDASALGSMKSVYLDDLRSPDVRLEAAIAAGQLVDQNLEADSTALAKSEPPFRNTARTCAVYLLSRHSSESARKVLTELAVDAEPTVAAAALRRLNEIDPALVLPLAEMSMKNADPLVRSEGVFAYIKLPDPARVTRLARMMDDNHPDVRKQAREGLFGLASTAELADPIRSAAMDVLSGDRWQGQEQAAMLLGALEFTPAWTRLIELLESPRDNVNVASAWAVKKIADPRSIPGILDKIRRQTEYRLANQPAAPLDLQVAHLLEACGRMRAQESTPILMQYIPKVLKLGERSRSAAIWSLGWLNEGKPNPPLGKALIARATDPSLMPPEFHMVKQHSAMAIARMKDVEHADALRKLFPDGTPNSNLGLGVRWAIKQLTGEELPEPMNPLYPQGVWFLEPLPPKDAN